MATDIENQDINELQQTIEKAQALIEQKKREKIGDAYKAAVEAAASVGLSLDELVAYGAKGKRAGAKRSVAPRYRNPANKEQTWTGRGKQPRWVVAALASGKTLEDLAI